MSSSLLITEPPLQVLPSLAKAIGLYQAIVLQQIHYLLLGSNNGKVIDGERWIFNTYEEWAGFFPFWDEQAIKRTMLSLERMGMIVSCQPEGGVSRRKYYRIPESARVFLTTDRLNDLTSLRDQPDEPATLPSVENDRRSVENDRSTVKNDLPSVENDQSNVSKTTVRRSKTTVPVEHRKLSEKTIRENPISVGSSPFPETQHGLDSCDLPENEVNPFAQDEPKPTPQMIALALIDGQRLEEVADWDQYRYLVGKLRKVCPGLTVANIEERAEWYRKSNPKWPLTAKALVSHWGKLRDEWYESFGWMTMPPANKQPEGKA